MSNIIRAALASIILAGSLSGVTGFASAQSVAADQGAMLRAELKAASAERKAAKAEFDNSAAGMAELRAKIAKARAKAEEFHAKALASK